MLRRVQSPLVLSLLVVLSLILPKAIPQAAQTGKQAAMKQVTLADLGKLYQEMELPLPPREARFACVGPQPVDGLIDSAPQHCELRFVIEKPDRKAVHEIWKEFSTTHSERIVELYPKTPTPDTVLQFMKLNRMSDSEYAIHPCQPELILAVQCHLLGHDELAKFFYWRCQNGVIDSAVPNIILKQVLLIVAWNFWSEQLVNSKSGRTNISKKLSILSTRHDILNLIADLYSCKEDEQSRKTIIASHEQVLKQLELTLRPTEAKPGSVNWLISKLTDATGNRGDESKWLRDEDPWDRQAQIRRRKAIWADTESVFERKLIDLGFEAIPDLIDHVDDQRLTRYPLTINHPFRPTGWATIHAAEFTVVGSVVREILAAYFDFPTSATDGEWKTKKGDYLNAWENLKRKSEVQFISQSIADRNRLEFNGALFNLIKSKYPEKLISLYGKVLAEYTDFFFFRKLVYFIVDSPLARAAKIDLLTRGARHENSLFQYEALAGLLELDNSLFTEICLNWLAKITQNANKKKESRHHLNLIRLSLCSEKPNAQQFLSTHVKTLSIESKVKLLLSLSPEYYMPGKRETLSFYRAFLVDSARHEVDDDKSLLPPTMRGFSKIEMRNLAAYRGLEILGIRLPLDEKTTPETWGKVRIFVKNEIGRRVEPEDGR